MHRFWYAFPISNVMNFKNKKTLLIAGGVVILLIIIVWTMLGSGGSDQTDTSLVVVASDPVELIIGREMLAALDEMKAVQLDTTFFDSPVYKSLEDFTVQIPKQPIGRRDPFAPI